ncbi:ribosome maturation factor RimP [Cellulomonas pakistanensis]|uniref:Ribosome maturation factor RimP n=1 Tax=Cellulomonas pakistanensis TaxID=992287 RepID=A0A919U8E3_9CELL|nr:ribosome maturation factor RimP [Cellulomonas pakistanensis]GIG37857.1 ribosome maturation factor RimP [Cellulomonas pakistanensis]
MPAPASAQRIRETIEPVVTAAGLWLEDVELGRDGARAVVRVVLDAPEDVEEQVDLDGVADVSRAVSAALDDLDGLPDRYTLEVSSRGATAPLVARRHYVRAIGRLVVLALADGGTLSGRLVDVERGAADGEDAVVVTPVTPGVKGRPAKVGEPVRVPLTTVREGRVEVELVRDKDDARGGDFAPDGPQGRED